MELILAGSQCRHQGSRNTRNDIGLQQDPKFGWRRLRATVNYVMHPRSITSPIRFQSFFRSHPPIERTTQNVSRKLRTNSLTSKCKLPLVFRPPTKLYPTSWSEKMGGLFLQALFQPSFSLPLPSLCKARLVEKLFITSLHEYLQNAQKSGRKHTPLRCNIHCATSCLLVGATSKGWGMPLPSPAQHRREVS